MPLLFHYRSLRSPSSKTESECQVQKDRIGIFSRHFDLKLVEIEKSIGPEGWVESLYSMPVKSLVFRLRVFRNKTNKMAKAVCTLVGGGDENTVYGSLIITQVRF